MDTPSRQISTMMAAERLLTAKHEAEQASERQCITDHYAKAQKALLRVAKQKEAERDILLDAKKTHKSPTQHLKASNAPMGYGPSARQTPKTPTLKRTHRTPSLSLLHDEAPLPPSALHLRANSPPLIIDEDIELLATPSLAANRYCSSCPPCSSCSSSTPACWNTTNHPRPLSTLITQSEPLHYDQNSTVIH